MSKNSSQMVLAVGVSNQWLGYLSDLLMLFAFYLFFGGFANKTPMGMVPAKPEAYGVTRITRHPMNMAFALFGLSHLLTNRLAVDWIFYLGFVVYGILGSAHQDRKKVRQSQGELEPFVNSTSILPFAALLAGKQKLIPGEISKIALFLAIAITIVARVLHPTLRSQLF